MTARSQSDTPAADALRMDEFVRLLAANQRRVYVYVMSLVPNATEADEVLQETNLVLWREFAKFEPGSNFAAWACKVAMFQVLAWRKRRKRDRLDFSPEFLEAVASESADNAEALEERGRLLAQCVAKLPAHQQEMLDRRYRRGESVEAIAAAADRTAEAVYRALSRVRASLHECVTRSLAQESHP